MWITALEVFAMRHTILVIDDQWSMQELARAVLQSAGYRVVLAGDDVTGLSLARAERPDLIIMDLRLPGTDGRAFLTELRRERATTAIPVVFIINGGLRERLPFKLKSNNACCLRKPFPPPTLITTVERALGAEYEKIAV